MRILVSFAVLAALTACTPAYLRDAPEAGGAYDPFAQSPAQAAAPVNSGGAIPSSEINSALFGTPTAPGTAAAAPVNPVPLGANIPSATPAVAFDGSEAALIAALPSHQGISDEQDFSAVSARETIEADKARLAANRAAYQEIAPSALPERPGDNQSAEVVNYALNAPNALGEAIYERKPVSAEAHQKACLRYRTDEEAQMAFLKSGGPKRDAKKLDPDGDGFACDWDPTPFQKARGG